MIISHNLNLNGYFINNEIWFDIQADANIVYFRLFLQNLNNGKTSSTFTAYADASNKARINIQSVVKSLFNNPNGVDGNSNQIKITIASDDGTSINFNKIFVRGGNRTNNTNQTIQSNQRMRISEKLPVFNGFPITENFINPDYSISTLELANISDIDYRRTKGCNNIYVKFLNQKGSYSYWLFESYGEKESNNSLGSLTDANNNLLDLGNESKSDLNIYSKFPKEYKQYPKDLIISPDVYVYQNASWKKVFSKSNSIEIDNVKKVYSLNINFDLNYRFNPSLLWSN